MFVLFLLGFIWIAYSEPILPGIFFVAKSVNIWRMNPFQGSSDPGFGKDLFILKYTRNCVKDGYLLPDAVCSDYVRMDSTNYNEIAGHVATSSDYQLYASKSTEFDKSVSLSGLDSDIDFFDFSLASSQEFSFAADFATNHKSNIVIKHLTCYNYEVTVSDYIAPDSLAYFDLDPELNQSVKELPVDGTDLTPYIKWLVKYGSHRIKELTAGATLTETTYFNETDYNVMVKEVADVEVAAQESTWFHTTSKSGSYSESVQASTFDKYAYGVQHYSAHGEVPSDNDPSGWIDKVHTNPVPVRMSLTPIFDIFTSSWFDDPNISKKQLNLARAMQDYCNPAYINITGGCYSPQPPPPPENISKEFYLGGSGSASLLMTPTSNTFCYIIGGHCWFAGGESCAVIRGQQKNDTAEYWYLSKGSGQSSFECGARCVLSLSDYVVNPEFRVSNVAGSTSHQILGSDLGFCFLTYGWSWGENSNSQHCHIYRTDSRNWMMETYSQLSNTANFGCGSTCVVWDKIKEASVTEFTLSGTGSKYKIMEDVEHHFCYINYGQRWYQGGEKCWISKEYVDGKIGEYWVLRQGSGQSSFICGAYCISAF